MDIKLCDDVNALKCDVLIINKFENKPTGNKLVDKYLPKSFTGEKGKIFVLHTHNEINAQQIITVGFGESKKADGNVIREATAKAIKKAIELKAKVAGLLYSGIKDYEKNAILGAVIANYRFDKYKTKKDDKLSQLYLSGVDKKILEQSIVIANSLDEARNLANEPAAYATPEKLAQIALNIDGLETVVFDKEKIEEIGMGAYLAVAQGSAEPPKFIHMKYAPLNAKKKIALIGKGLCFDSGGLDIKPASSMLNMKDDMSGAACVLAVMRAIAKLEPDIEVHGIIAACENMPSSNSYKPGDIVIAKNGKTIEVDNTDAEGRLTLADALCYACELDVDEVIDIATLTGACMVALGTAASGIMGNCEELVKNIIEVGQLSGEKFWELPMFQEYRDNMDSSVADMKNTGTRYGGASAAGMFLKEFVTDNVKWAHLDVAGTAFLESPQREFGKGATGIGVRTLINYIISH